MEKYTAYIRFTIFLFMFLLVLCREGSSHHRRSSSRGADPWRSQRRSFSKPCALPASGNALSTGRAGTALCQDFAAGRTGLHASDRYLERRDLHRRNDRGSGHAGDCDLCLDRRRFQGLSRSIQALCESALASPSIPWSECPGTCRELIRSTRISNLSAPFPRPKKRHGQPPRSRRNLSVAHRKWQLCGLQHVAIQPVQAQEADGLHQSWFEVENSHWREFLSSPQKLEETLSKRLDADKLVFSPRLNHLQMNALQNAQNSDSFRLQQLYQSIRNLEASLANKRRAIGAQHNCRFVSRILGYRQSRAMQLVAKLGTTVERRSVRELQSLLFKLKSQCRTLHKNYSKIHGFSSYAHRSAQYQHRSSLSL